MADIAMCQGIDCPIKEQCYRHTAPESDHWQSWNNRTYNQDELGCNEFIDNKDRQKAKKFKRANTS